MKLTIDAFSSGWDGLALAGLLRTGGVEAEHADANHVVLMASGATDCEALRIAADSPGLAVPRPRAVRPALPLAKGERVLSIREAFFAPHETVPAVESFGRICGAPAVSCPPAIPIAVSGERIGPEAVALFQEYGIEKAEVLKENFC